MNTKKALTEAAVRRFKPAPKGKRIVHWDALVPGFGVRVTDKGKASYFVQYRLKGEAKKPPKKYTFGPAGEGGHNLAETREKARHIVAAAKRGIDLPAQERDEIAARAAEPPADTVAAAIETYLRLIVIGSDPAKPKQRQGAKVAREIRRELLGRWGVKPLHDITKRDVIAMVDDIAARGTPGMARNVLGHAKAFFAWCEAHDMISLSPAAPVKPKALLGAKPVRKRVLTDDELFALWRVSGRLGYPFGPMYRMLALTGCRLEEVAGARWREFHPELVRLLRKGEPIDWAKVPASVKTWTVPAARFKSDAEHLVMLSDEACAVLASLPIFTEGDHVFTTTGGERPVSGFSKAKARLDKAMWRTLKALARLRGAELVEASPFVNHDIRRTVRTRLSGLKVPAAVAEMVIGHGKTGLGRVYDQHEYADEMRDALTQWAGKLRDIAAPAPSNVVQLDAQGRTA